MGDIVDSANQTFRDYVVDGVPSSGPNEPLKSDIRDTFEVVETIVNEIAAGNGVGFLTYTTLASMNADTTQADHTTAQNLEDSNIYRWDDGGNAWVLIGPNPNIRLDAIEAETYVGAGVIMDTLKRTMTNQLSGVNANKAYNESGVLTTSSGRYASDLIRVSSTAKITRYGTGVLSGSPNFPPFSFFDADQVHLGYAYNSTTNNVQTYDMADAPAGTVFVGLMGNSTISAYIYEPTLLDFLKDMLFSLFGTPVNQAEELTNQYFNKTTGTIANSSSWRLSPALRVNGDSYIVVTGGLVSDTQTSQAQIGFYSSETLQDNTTFLGYYNSKAPNECVKVSDHYPTALSVLVAMPSTDIGEVYVVNYNENYERYLDVLSTSLIVNWFDPDLVVGGRLDTDGSLTQQTGDWRVTDFIPVVEGQVFYLTTTNATGAGPTVAGYSSSQAFVEAVVQLTTGDNKVNYRFEIPAGISYIRASHRFSSSPNTLIGARTSNTQTANASGLSYLAPQYAYGRVGEGIYVYGAGIVGDDGVDVSFTPATPGDFDTFYGSDKCYMEKTVEGETTVSVKAFYAGVSHDLGDMVVRATDTASLASPPKTINLIPIGDSTTSQLSSSDANSTDGNGVWANEVQRQITGVGDHALVVAASGYDSLNTGSEWGAVVSGDIRAALARTDFKVRGTRGSGTVKHEGRGGWHPSNYLERTASFTITMSADFVTGNSFSGEITDGTTVRTIGPVPFSTNHATTMTNVAAAIQTAMRLYGTGTNPPVATVTAARVITVTPKWNLTFDEADFLVTGGASQPTVDIGGDGKVNAFWNGTEFSMSHYIATYGFGVADDPTHGIDATGSNLVVVLALGWNDVGDNTAAGTSAGHMAEIIDLIHAEYPDATVIVPSLWAPPPRSLKGNTSTISKTYSRSQVFDSAIREYGTAYKNMCESLDRTLSSTVLASKTIFHQVSHQIDPDYAFSKSSYPPNRTATDTTLEIDGTGDHVHMRRRGYRMLADPIVDLVLWLFYR